MSKNIGLKLRQARLSREITLAQAAQSTHISQRYLAALEDGNFEIIPSLVQMRGFLRSYADYLGLDVNEITAPLRESGSPTAQPHPLQQTSSEQPNPKDVEAQSIFQALGQSLRDRRELISLTPSEVEQHTHISSQYLKYMESGDFSRFPSPVQARGMLVNYAEFLDMDADKVMLHYAEAIQAQFIARQPEEPKEEREKGQNFKVPIWVRNLVSPDLIFVVILSLAIVVFLVWGINRIAATQVGQVEQPTAPSIADVLLPTATTLPTQPATPELLDIDIQAELTSEAGEDQFGDTLVLPGSDQGNIRITLVVHQRTWMRVTVDGQVAFDGRVSPGELLSFTGEQQIEILTGNAAALQVFYNDQDMGLLGFIGEIINVIYTEFGVVAPTPTLVPTSTPTSSVAPAATIPAP